MAARDPLPSTSPAAAADAYREGQAAAAQGPRPSTAATRTQLGSARTSGNNGASTRS